VGLGCPATATELEPHADFGLGFDAQALIDLVSGTHRESLLWLDGFAVRADAGAATTGSSSTQLSIEIEVTGAAQLLSGDDVVVPPDAPPGAVPGAHCRSSVGLPVRVHLESSDGALGTSADTLLESISGDFARLAFVVPAGQLSKETNSVLSVELGITRLGSMGSLSLYQRLADGSLDPHSTPLAHFPAHNYCSPPPRSYNYTSQLYLAPDQEFRGISLQGQLARLNRASPVSARLQGDASRRPLSLSFASTDDHLCLELEAFGCYDAFATIAGTVRMSTEDGVIDGELPVSFIVGAGDELPPISINAYRAAVPLDKAPALLESSGIHAAMQYTDQFGVAVLFGALLDGEDLQGSLAVVGQSPCKSAPGSTECAFVQPIWFVDWGGAPHPYEENFCGPPRPARFF
jgi:hypothetical protein